MSPTTSCTPSSSSTAAAAAASNNDNDIEKSSTSNSNRRTISDFVEASFASIDKLCNPISSAVALAKGTGTITVSSSSSSNNSNNNAVVITTNSNNQQTSNSSTNNRKKKSYNNINATTSTTSDEESNKHKNKEEELVVDDGNNDGDDACTAFTYLALLTALYLPLLLFLWIKRTMIINTIQLEQEQQFITSPSSSISPPPIHDAVTTSSTSLVNSLFLSHLLRLLLAFFLLPPSTTKKFIPKVLWNSGLYIMNVMERQWKKKNVQKYVPNWIHLLLALILGVENENIPYTIVLANILGSTTSSHHGNDNHNERDIHHGGSGAITSNSSGSSLCLSSSSSHSNSWPPPSLVALGIFTLVAIVVHPDGLTWIMLSQIRKWIHDGIHKMTHTIQMIQNGSIKITLAELSGTIAGIIIIVTILLAIFNPKNHSNDVHTHHGKGGGRNGIRKHKKGKKKGGGGRHHHHNKASTSSSSDESRIKSRHYRSEDEDVFESTLLPTPTCSSSNGRCNNEVLKSRSTSPLGRTRCESDMENTTVSAVSDSGFVVASTESLSSTIASNSVNELKNKVSDKKIKALASSLLPQMDDNNLKYSTSVSTSVVNGHCHQNHQKKQDAWKKNISLSSNDRDKVSSNKSQIQGNKYEKSNAISSPYSSSSSNGRLPERRLQPLTNNDRNNNINSKQKFIVEKPKRSKKKRTKQGTHDARISMNSDDADFLPTMKNKNFHSPKHQSTTQNNSQIKKNYEDDTFSCNNNAKVRDFECDATIGSNASYSNSGSSQIVHSPVGTRSPLAYQSMSEKAGVQNIRRRSFTDPNVLSHPHSSCMTASFNQANVAVVRHSESNVNVLAYKERNTSMSFHQVHHNEHRLFEDSGCAIDSYHRHDFASSSPFYRMNVQQDDQYERSNDNYRCNESQTNRDLNSQVIRPPPGLELSQQHSVGQGLPYLTGSSTSLGLSCSDHGTGPTSSSGIEFSQRSITTLPPISPLHHRQAPNPIGYERVSKHHNDEEIESHLLELGGQMAGSILDF